MEAIRRLLALYKGILGLSARACHLCENRPGIARMKARRDHREILACEATKAMASRNLWHSVLSS